jgi:hypothetical protein
LERPLGGPVGVATVPRRADDPNAVLAAPRVPAHVGRVDAVSREPLVDGLAEDDGLAFCRAAPGSGPPRLAGDPVAFVDHGGGESQHPFQGHLVGLGQFLR